MRVEHVQAPATENPSIPFGQLMRGVPASHPLLLGPQRRHAPLRRHHQRLRPLCFHLLQTQPSDAAHLCSNNNNNHTSVISEHVSLILREIDFSQKKLSQMEKELLGYENIDLSLPNAPPELSSFLHCHLLPLGKDSRSSITELVSSVGHSCATSFSLLSSYIVYKPDSTCPDDSHLAFKLVAKDCEPLPRRRCFARTVQKIGLLSFPTSLWGNVSDKVVSNWNGYACKGFGCLNGKKFGGDCAGGCFDLGDNGAER